MFIPLTLLALTIGVGNASQVYLPAQIFSYGPIGPNGSATATFDAFDSSAYAAGHFRAVLTSVELILSSTSSGVISVLNLNSSPVPFTDAFTQIPVTVSALGIRYQTIAVAATCGTFTTPSSSPENCVNSANGVSGIAYPMGTEGLAPIGVASNAVNQVSGVVGTTTHNGFANPGVYSAYTGGAGATVSVDIASGGASSGGIAIPGVSFGGTSTTTGTLSLIYGYDLVHNPEPATMVLTGGALLALGFFGRKRLQQNQK